MKSSTIIGGAGSHERHEADFYPTPWEATQALIDTDLIPQGTVWEPACGDGAISKVLKVNGFNVISSDLRETGYGTQMDFLAATPNHCSPQSIITNPPFKHAVQFIERSMHYQPACVAMLVKSQYWHSMRRTGLFEEHPPAYILALNWRPDFCGGARGNSPTMDMIWTVWLRGETDTRYRILKKPKTIKEAA